MGAIGVVLLVAFVIICVISVLLILVQNQDNSGMGSMLGGGNSTAFGSHSASVLTKTTITFVVLFFVVAFSLALINKKSSTADDLAETAKSMNINSEMSSEKTSDWWKEESKTSVQEDKKVEPSVYTDESGVIGKSAENSEKVDSTKVEETKSE